MAVAAPGAFTVCYSNSFFLNNLIKSNNKLMLWINSLPISNRLKIVFIYNALMAYNCDGNDLVGIMGFLTFTKRQIPDEFHLTINCYVHNKKCSYCDKIEYKMLTLNEFNELSFHDTYSYNLSIAYSRKITTNKNFYCCKNCNMNINVKKNKGHNVIKNIINE